MIRSLAWDLRWHTPHGWEKEYVRSQLLSGVPVATEFPPLCVGGVEAQLRSPLSCQPLTAFRRGRVIAVFRSRQGSSVANAEVVHRYAAAGATPIAVVLGDENLALPCGRRNSSSCTSAPCRARTDLHSRARLVLRNYFDATCATRKNVLTLPLGVRSGTTHSAQQRRQPRTIVWAFASAHATPLRTTLVQLLLAAGAPRHRLAYPGTTDEYASWLSQAQLAPTPSGNSPDTWRFMEALDCGALPILDANASRYYRRWLPASLTSTFVHLEVACAAAVHEQPARCSHSASALAALERLLQQPTQLEARRLTMVKAYEAWRAATRAHVMRRVAAL